MKQQILFFGLCLFFTSSFSQLEKPQTAKVPSTLIIHGDTLIDNYFWMRDKYSPEVINHLYAENEYADRIMKRSALLQKVIFEEFKGRRKQTYTTHPSKLKGYYYYSKFEAGKDYPVYCRKKDSLKAPEQIYLDVNKISENYGYTQISSLDISPNQQLLYYGIDTKGNRLSDFYIKNIDRDSIFISDTLKQISTLIWAEDNKTVFYVMPEPKTLRSNKIYKHVLGTPVSSDALVFEETDKLFDAEISKSASKQYFFITTSSKNSSECWYFKADGTEWAPKLFLERKDKVHYSLNHYEGDEFYISTNLNAINYRFTKTNIKNSDPKSWIDILPGRNNVMLQNVRMTKDHMIIEEKENAQSRVRIINRKTNQEESIPVDIPLYEISLAIPDYDYKTSTAIEYSYQNMITPAKKFSYNLYTKEKNFLDEDTILGNYNPAVYDVKRIYATAPDGEKVPITLCHKKGLQLSGTTPTYLSSYGSYGIATTTHFASQYLSYLERGFIVAIAHIRGGDDLGELWYENGKMLKKKNTFTDFIACAEHLISEKYTNASRLAIQGGSAGGLLMGAVTNMRPDLFSCVVANVPFVDVINTMLDESLPLTTGEFEEWGNPKIKEYYSYMKSYSPYDNVERKNYPNILATSGYDDSQVAYWEPAKWVAKLREYKTDTNLLLFKTTMQGGHGGPSGRYSEWKESAFQLAFVMHCLGIKENYLTISGKVIDENNSEVPFANVYIDGTTNGTTTNANGEFAIKIKEMDNISLVVQSIGFMKHKEKLTINTPTDNLKIKIKSENILMKEVVVSANAKDPALGIIKQAISKRKENQEKLQSFSANVYMKSYDRLLEIPKKGPIRKMLINQGDTSKGLIYLSESVAKYYFERPDKTKEEMIASKVAGEKQGFSWNRVEDVFMSFYNPTVKFYYSEREFISPIAPTALVSYKYKYKGTMYVDDKPVHKIQVSPRMKGDPAFYGEIYITEDNYQIYSCNLYALKEQQIEFTDTAYLRQEMEKVDGMWLPIQLQMYCRFSFMGIKATSLSMGSMSNYVINKPFSKNFFSRELFRINEEANKKDTSYWKTTRPSVLTGEEITYYKKRDSIEVKKESKEYRDSVLKVENKFSFGKLLVSGLNRNFETDKSKTEVHIPGILFIPNYNTVQGTNLGLPVTITKREKATKKKTEINTYLQYVIDNQQINFAGEYFKQLNILKRQSVSLGISRMALQINTESPIIPVVNSLYTLLGKQNYMKLYQEDRINGKYKQEIANGIFLNSEVQYKIRESLVNRSYYYWIDNNKHTFTGNNPVGPDHFAPAFSKHRAVELKTSLDILLFANYETSPVGRSYTTKWPEINIDYKKGIATSGASFNYDFLSANIGKDIGLRTWGQLSVDVSGGLFFNTNNMNFIDYKHFFGNQTALLNSTNNITRESGRKQLVNFKALPYYSNSTNKKYVEAHIEHNFNSFLIGKIPLLHKTRVAEVIGMNVLITPDITYTEYYIGLDKIASVFRVDGVVVYDTKGKPTYYLRLGLSML